MHNNNEPRKKRRKEESMDPARLSHYSCRSVSRYCVGCWSNSNISVHWGGCTYYGMDWLCHSGNLREETDYILVYLLARGVIWNMTTSRRAIYLHTQERCITDQCAFKSLMRENESVFNKIFHPLKPFFVMEEMKSYDFQICKWHRQIVEIKKNTCYDIKMQMKYFFGRDGSLIFQHENVGVRVGCISEILPIFHSKYFL